MGEPDDQAGAVNDFNEEEDDWVISTFGGDEASSSTNMQADSPRRNSIKHKAIMKAVRPILSSLYRPEFSGQENIPSHGGFILVGNHLSSFDALPLYDFCQTVDTTPYVMAKGTLFKVPVVKNVVASMRGLPVERGTERAKGVLSQAEAVLAQGQCVALFPEGTTTREEQYWPMTAKTGAARLALKTGVPVIPFGQWGTQRVQPRYSVLPRVGRRNRVVLQVGPAVDLTDLLGKYDDYEAVAEATARIMQRVTRLVERLRGEKAPNGVYDMRIDGDPFGKVPSRKLASMDRRQVKVKKRQEGRGLSERVLGAPKPQTSSLGLAPSHVPLINKSVTLMVSTASNNGKNMKRGPAVAAALRERGVKVKVRLCTLADDVVQVAANFGDSQVIAALGGDGFVSLVGRGAMNAERILAPLPGGRGNDFCAKLGVPRDVVSAAWRLPDLNPHLVDTISVMDARTNERTIQGVVSIGLDARTNEHANQYTRISGTGAYVGGLIWALTATKPEEYLIEIDGETTRERLWMCALANSGNFGGGMKISPNSVLDDGLLEVVTVAAVSPATVLKVLPKVFSGGHITHPAVQIRLGKSVRVEATGAIESTGAPTSYGDGDQIGPLPLEAQINPGSLLVLS